MPFAARNAPRAIAFEIEHFDVPRTDKGRVDRIRALRDIRMRTARGQRFKHFIAVHSDLPVARTRATGRERPCATCQSCFLRALRDADGSAQTGRIPALPDKTVKPNWRFQMPEGRFRGRIVARLRYGMFWRNGCAL